MLRSRKFILISAGLTVFAIAGAVLLYSGLRRGEAAQASPAAELFSDCLPERRRWFTPIWRPFVLPHFIKQRPDHGPIALPDRDYADFVQSTGFNFEKDLDRVAMAAWPPEPGQEKNKPAEQKIILVARGAFRPAQDSCIMQCGKERFDRQQGHDVFSFRIPLAPA